MRLELQAAFKTNNKKVNIIKKLNKDFLINKFLKKSCLKNNLLNKSAYFQRRFCFK